jgi:hypothetical protein
MNFWHIKEHRNELQYTWQKSNFTTNKQTCKGEVEEDPGPQKIAATNFISNTGTGPYDVT